MSYAHRIYRGDGTFWIDILRDDTARTVTTYNEAGAITGSRPYDATENARADLREAQSAEIATAQAKAAVLDAIAAGGAPLVLVVPEVAGRALVLTDAHKAVEVNSATPVSVTVPLNATVAFPIGTLIEVYQRGAGQVSIAATGVVTIESRGALRDLAGQYAVASLRKRATDTWVLTGDLA